MLVLIGRALGYAELDELKITGEEILLRIKSNWESACLRKRYKTPQCYWTKGLLKGFAEEFTKVKWNVEEETCIAAGEKYCTFILKKA